MLCVLSFTRKLNSLPSPCKKNTVPDVMCWTNIYTHKHSSSCIGRYIPQINKGFKQRKKSSSGAACRSDRASVIWYSKPDTHFPASLFLEFWPKPQEQEHTGRWAGRYYHICSMFRLARGCLTQERPWYNCLHQRGPECEFSEHVMRR